MCVPETGMNLDPLRNWGGPGNRCLQSVLRYNCDFRLQIAGAEFCLSGVKGLGLLYHI